MAVVTTYSPGYPNPNALSAYSMNSAMALSRMRVSTFSIAVNNGDSIGSIYKLARLPSKANILGLSQLYVPVAIAGLAVSCGFTDNFNTNTVVPAAFMNAVSVTAGGTFPMLSALALSNSIAQLWQILQQTNAAVTQDPGSTYDLLLQVTTAPTASGTLLGEIFWADDNP